MQASKIMPHSIYAIRDGETLKRFKVTAVVTRRTNSHGNPQDYDSSVEGFVIYEDGGARDQVRTLDPKLILGPFQEQVELAERDRLEKAESAAKVKARDEKTQRLIDKLCAATGLPLAENVHKRAFRAGYQGDLDVTVEGVDALLALLERSHVFSA